MDAPAFEPAPSKAANSLFQDDDARWAAVEAKDRRADGRFVTGVVSTGIYCRPSCAARTPLRKNVRFFETPKAAENAGLRACKRCAPDRRDADAALVARAAGLIAEGEGEVTAAALAAALGVGPAALRAAFKRATGLASTAFLRAARAERFRSCLQKEGDVLTAIYEAGFSSPSRAYAAAGDALGGLAPATYAKGGKGARIRIAVAQTGLGPLAIAATDKGVAAISFGDDERALASELAARFHAAEIAPADASTQAWLAEAVAMVEEPGAAGDLPLDIRATAFQARVWAALREIPLGETKSYAAVAAEIGSPKAVRAVANACARNPVPLTVPCHRVVGSDGSLTGYAFGKERKATLLEREKKAAERP